MMITGKSIEKTFFASLDKLCNTDVNQFLQEFCSAGKKLRTAQVVEKIGIESLKQAIF